MFNDANSPILDPDIAMFNDGRRLIFEPGFTMFNDAHIPILNPDIASLSTDTDDPEFDFMLEKIRASTTELIPRRPAPTTPANEAAEPEGPDPRPKSSRTQSRENRGRRLEQKRLRQAGRDARLTNKIKAEIRRLQLDSGAEYGGPPTLQLSSDDTSSSEDNEPEPDIRLPEYRPLFDTAFKYRPEVEQPAHGQDPDPKAAESSDYWQTSSSEHVPDSDSEAEQAYVRREQYMPRCRYCRIKTRSRDSDGRCGRCKPRERPRPGEAVFRWSRARARGLSSSAGLPTPNSPPGKMHTRKHFGASSRRTEWDSKAG